MELNNPLRKPTTLRRESGFTNEESLAAKSPSVKPSDLNVKIEDGPSSKLKEAVSSYSDSRLSTNVKKMLEDIDPSHTLDELLQKFKEKGIELTGPKRTYVKHSYEIDSEIHQKFHKMYPVLGFKKLKDAINDVLSEWCDKNEAEFKRRCGE